MADVFYSVSWMGKEDGEIVHYNGGTYTIGVDAFGDYDRAFDAGDVVLCDFFLDGTWVKGDYEDGDPVTVTLPCGSEVKATIGVNAYLLPENTATENQSGMTWAANQARAKGSAVYLNGGTFVSPTEKDSASLYTNGAKVYISDSYMKRLTNGRNGNTPLATPETYLLTGSNIDLLYAGSGTNEYAYVYVGKNGYAATISPAYSGSFKTLDVVIDGGGFGSYTGNATPITEKLNITVKNGVTSGNIKLAGTGGNAVFNGFTADVNITVENSTLGTFDVAGRGDGVAWHSFGMRVGNVNISLKDSTIANIISVNDQNFDLTWSAESYTVTLDNSIVSNILDPGNRKLNSGAAGTLNALRLAYNGGTAFITGGTYCSAPGTPTDVAEDTVWVDGVYHYLGVGGFGSSQPKVTKNADGSLTVTNAIFYNADAEAGKRYITGGTATLTGGEQALVTLRVIGDKESYAKTLGRIEAITIDAAATLSLGSNVDSGVSITIDATDFTLEGASKVVLTTTGSINTTDIRLLTDKEYILNNTGKTLEIVEKPNVYSVNWSTFENGTEITYDGATYVIGKNAFGNYADAKASGKRVLIADRYYDVEWKDKSKGDTVEVVLDGETVQLTIGEEAFTSFSAAQGAYNPGAAVVVSGGTLTGGRTVVKDCGGKTTEFRNYTAICTVSGDHGPVIAANNQSGTGVTGKVIIGKGSNVVDVTLGRPAGALTDIDVTIHVKDDATVTRATAVFNQTATSSSEYTKSETGELLWQGGRSQAHFILTGGSVGVVAPSTYSGGYTGDIFVDVSGTGQIGSVLGSNVGNSQKIEGNFYINMAGGTIKTIDVCVHATGVANRYFAIVAGGTHTVSTIGALTGMKNASGASITVNAGNHGQLVLNGALDLPATAVITVNVDDFQFEQGVSEYTVLTVKSGLNKYKDNIRWTGTAIDEYSYNITDTTITVKAKDAYFSSAWADLEDGTVVTTPGGTGIIGHDAFFRYEDVVARAAEKNWGIVSADRYYSAEWNDLAAGAPVTISNPSGTFSTKIGDAAIPAYATLADAQKAAKSVGTTLAIVGGTWSTSARNNWYGIYNTVLIGGSLTGSANGAIVTMMDGKQNADYVATFTVGEGGYLSSIGITGNNVAEKTGVVTPSIFKTLTYNAVNGGRIGGVYIIGYNAEIVGDLDINVANGGNIGTVKTAVVGGKITGNVNFNISDGGKINTLRLQPDSRSTVTLSDGSSINVALDGGTIGTLELDGDTLRIFTKGGGATVNLHVSGNAASTIGAWDNTYVDTLTIDASASLAVNGAFAYTGTITVDATGYIAEAGSKQVFSVKNGFSNTYVLVGDTDDKYILVKDANALYLVAKTVVYSAAWKNLAEGDIVTVDGGTYTIGKDASGNYNDACAYAENLGRIVDNRDIYYSADWAGKSAGDTVEVVLDGMTVSQTIGDKAFAKLDDAQKKVKSVIDTTLAVVGGTWSTSARNNWYGIYNTVLIGGSLTGSANGAIVTMMDGKQNADYVATFTVGEGGLLSSIGITGNNATTTSTTLSIFKNLTYNAVDGGRIGQIFTVGYNAGIVGDLDINVARGGSVGTVQSAVSGATIEGKVNFNVSDGGVIGNLYFQPSNGSTTTLKSGSSINVTLDGGTITNFAHDGTAGRDFVKEEGATVNVLVKGTATSEIGDWKNTYVDTLTINVGATLALAPKGTFAYTGTITVDAATCDYSEMKYLLMTGFTGDNTFTVINASDPSYEIVAVGKNVYYQMPTVYFSILWKGLEKGTSVRLGNKTLTVGTNAFGSYGDARQTGKFVVGVDVYVNNTWTEDSDIEIDGYTATFGSDAFATFKDGVDNAKSMGGAIRVEGGEYAGLADWSTNKVFVTGATVTGASRAGNICAADATKEITFTDTTLTTLMASGMSGDHGMDSYRGSLVYNLVDSTATRVGLANRNTGTAVSGNTAKNMQKIKFSLTGSTVADIGNNIGGDQNGSNVFTSATSFEITLAGSTVTGTLSGDRITLATEGGMASVDGAEAVAVTGLLRNVGGSRTVGKDGTITYTGGTTWFNGVSTNGTVVVTGGTTNFKTLNVTGGTSYVKTISEIEKINITVDSTLAFSTINSDAVITIDAANCDYSKAQYLILDGASDWSNNYTIINDDPGKKYEFVEDGNKLYYQQKPIYFSITWKDLASGSKVIVNGEEYTIGDDAFGNYADAQATGRTFINSADAYLNSTYNDTDPITVDGYPAKFGVDAFADITSAVSVANTLGGALRVTGGEFGSTDGTNNTTMDVAYLEMKDTVIYNTLHVKNGATTDVKVMISGSTIGNGFYAVEGGAQGNVDITLSNVAVTYVNQSVGRAFLVSGEVTGNVNVTLDNGTKFRNDVYVINSGATVGGDVNVTLGDVEINKNGLCNKGTVSGSTVVTVAGTAAVTAITGFANININEEAVLVFGGTTLTGDYSNNGTLRLTDDAFITVGEGNYVKIGVVGGTGNIEINDSDTVSVYQYEGNYYTATEQSKAYFNGGYAEKDAFDVVKVTEEGGTAFVGVNAFAGFGDANGKLAENAGVTVLGGTVTGDYSGALVFANDAEMTVTGVISSTTIAFKGQTVAFTAAQDFSDATISVTCNDTPDPGKDTIIATGVLNLADGKTITVNDKDWTIGDSKDKYKLCYKDNKLYITDETSAQINVEIAPATWTSGNVTVTATYISTDNNQYSVDGGATWVTVEGDTVTLTAGTNGICYEFRAQNAKEPFDVITSGATVTNIDKEDPTISVSVDPEEGWTRDPVTITVDCSDTLSGVKSFEYSFDGGATWIVGGSVSEAEVHTFSGTFTVDHNTGYQIRAIDQVGNVSEVFSGTITNIDTIDPKVAGITPSVPGGTWTKGPVVVSGTFFDVPDELGIASGIADNGREYKIDDGEWQNYVDGGTVTANGVITFRATDNVGNEYEESYTVTNIDTEDPTISVSVDPEEGWTRDPVTITVDCSDTLSGVKSFEYSFDGGATWIVGGSVSEAEVHTFSGTFTVDHNTGYQIRAIDQVGNVSEVFSGTITNIDTTPPTIESSQSEPSDGVSIVTGTFFDVPDELGIASGIDPTTKQYQIGMGEWKVYPDDGVVMVEDGTVSFQVYDNAGNLGTGYCDVKGLGSYKPTITNIREEIDGTTVTVKADFADVGSGIYLREYSLDDKATWRAYDPEKGIVLDYNTAITFHAVDNVGNETYATHEVISSAGPTITVNWVRDAENNVTVSADYSEGTSKALFSLDEGAKWQEYNGVISVSSDDTATVFFATNDPGAGVFQSWKGAAIFNPKWNDDTLTYTVEFNAEKGWEIASKLYRINNGEWQTYDEETGVTGLGNCEITFRVVDKSGSTFDVIREIDSVKKPTISVNVTPSEWTKDPVTVSADFFAGSDVNVKISSKEYSLDDGFTWKNYTGSFTVSDNKKIRFRMTTSNGKSADASVKIGNIDRIKPTITRIREEEVSGGTATVKADFADVGSGIKTQEYKIGSGTFTTYDPETGITGVKEGVTVYFKAVDNVGNEQTAYYTTETYLPEVITEQKTIGKGKTYEVGKLAIKDSGALIVDGAKLYVNQLTLDGGTIVRNDGDVTLDQIVVKSGTTNRIVGGTSTIKGDSLNVGKNAALTMDLGFYEHCFDKGYYFTADGAVKVEGDTVSQWDIQTISDHNAQGKSGILKQVDFDGEVLNVNKLQLKGNFDVSFNGMTGTAKNDKITFAKNAVINFGGGTVIDFGEGSDTLALEANAKITINSQEIKNVTTVSAANGAELTAGNVTMSGKNVKMSFGNYNNVTLDAVKMAADGKLTVGSDAKFTATSLYLDNESKKSAVSVGARSSVSVEDDIAGVNTLSFANGTELEADDLSASGNGAKFTFGNNSDVDVDKVEMTLGNDTLTIGKGSVWESDAIEFHSGNDKLTISGGEFAAEAIYFRSIEDAMSTETLSIGASADVKIGEFSESDETEFIGGDIMGVTNLTTAKEVTLIAGTVTAFGKSAKMSFGDYNTVDLDDVMMTSGNDTLSIGKMSEFTADSLDFGAGNDKLTISGGTFTAASLDFGSGNDTLNIGASAKVTIDGDIKDVTTLTAAAGKSGNETKLTAGTVTFETNAKNTKMTFGNNSIVELAYLNMAAWGGSLTIGKDSTFTVSEIGFRENQKNSISVGSNSVVEIKGEVFNVSNLTLVNGSAVKNGDPKYTQLTVAGALRATGNSAKFTFGNYTEVEVGGNVSMWTGNDTLSIGKNSYFAAKEINLMDGNDKLTIGNESVFTADKLNFGSGNDTLSIGASADVKIGGDITGITTLTSAAGKSGNETVLTAGNVAFDTEAKSAKMTFGNYSEVNVGDVAMTSGNDTLSVGKDSVFAGVAIDMRAGNDKLTVSGGEFTAASLDFGLGNDTLTFGNGVTAQIGALDFGDGTDTWNIGSNSEATVRDLNVDSLDKFTIGKNSVLYVSTEDVCKKMQEKFSKYASQICVLK
ncbi:MAG: hypothetical protein MJ033_04660 [Victivallaceae bacterium]|nr:hypothetical protein [Victivallaceae bacterium]